MNRLHSFVTFALIIVAFSVGCKKDDISDDNQNVSAFNLRTPVDDPDVEVQNIDVSINTKRNVYYFDSTINIAAFNIPLKFSIYQNINNDSYKYIDVFFNYDSNLYLQNEIAVFSDKTSASSREFLLPTYSEGIKIETSESIWNPDWNGINRSGLIYIKSGNKILGMNDIKDRYIPFRKKVGSDYYYGWIKLNLSPDASKLIIKSVAYCNVANKAFYFGDY